MKVKNVKYLMGVMILVASVTGLSGCVNPSQGKKQAAEALRQKYGEEFEVTAFREAGILEDYFTVQAYSVEHPDLLFKATVDKSGNIMDPYVTLRLCDRISDKISQNLGTLENDYYVYTEAMLGHTIMKDPMISLEEYMKEAPGNQFNIYLCLNQKKANLQNIISSILNMMNGISGIRGAVYLYLTDFDLLAQIQDYVTSHDQIYTDFDEMTEEAYIGYVEFENGKISITEETLKKMAGDRL